MNPVEEYLKEKTAAGFRDAFWKGIKFQGLEQGLDQAGKVIKPTGLETFGNVMGSQLTAGAAVGGITLGGEAVIGGMRKLVNMGIDKWRKPMEYKAMLDAHPELQQQDAAKVQALYNSLRHMSPHMAKDPVIAGSFVRNLLERGNEGSVAVPMDTAKLLADTQKSVSNSKHTDPSMFPDFMSKGVANAQGTMFKHDLEAPEREEKTRTSNERERRESDREQRDALKRRIGK